MQSSCKSNAERAIKLEDDGDDDGQINTYRQTYSKNKQYTLNTQTQDEAQLVALLNPLHSEPCIRTKTLVWEGGGRCVIEGGHGIKR